MNKKIIQIVFVFAFCVLFTACNYCHLPSKRNVKIDRENYNSVRTVNRYFTVWWEDRGFIDDYQGTVKVYDWTHWRGGKKCIGLQHEEGGSPSMDIILLGLTDEEIRPLVDTTTFWRKCYVRRQDFV